MLIDLFVVFNLIKKLSTVSLRIAKMLIRISLNFANNCLIITNKYLFKNVVPDVQTQMKGNENIFNILIQIN